mgnify:CR=1 FL=1
MPDLKGGRRRGLRPGSYRRHPSLSEDFRQYPTITFVLDVHRDAISDGDGSPYKVVSGVAGANAAQMSFVIGTDGGGLEHPYWWGREAEKVPSKLAASMEWSVRLLIYTFPATR